MRQLALILLIGLSLADHVWASLDPFERGIFATTTGEYRMMPEVDPEVLGDRMTEIWARVYYPQELGSIKHPLIFFLHGNHATCGIGTAPRRDISCEYTYSGTCSNGYTVTPNHEGYGYAADLLASWGYIVVSINANRGITCGDGIPGDDSLNLARGRLVLKHLALWTTWEKAGNAPASIGVDGSFWHEHIDFGQVGLMGHSRGGEGVRAALNFLKDPGSKWQSEMPELNIRGIFEIGAVDRGSDRILDAPGAAWNQLLPMCDGDVSDLQGADPFERMLVDPTETQQKSLLYVWGANHNYFNTEWQVSDSNYCFAAPGTTHPKIFDPKLPGSERQKKIAQAAMTAFFRTKVPFSGTLPLPEQFFNTLYPMPQSVQNITRIGRDFTLSPASDEALRVDDFDRDSGVNTSGEPNTKSNVQVLHTNLSHARVAKVSWNELSEANYYQLNWIKQGLGRDISRFATLDFRVSRGLLFGGSNIDFSVALVDSSDSVSRPIALSSFAQLNPPGNSTTASFQSVRIPLESFEFDGLSSVQAVRFTFDRGLSHQTVYIANVRIVRDRDASMLTLESTTPMNSEINTDFDSIVEPIPSIVNSEHNRIASIKTSGNFVEIELASDKPFPVTDALPQITWGEMISRKSKYPRSGRTDRLIFMIEKSKFHPQAANVAPVVRIGRDLVWLFRDK